MNQPACIRNIRFAAVASALSSLMLVGCNSQPNVLQGVRLAADSSPQLNAALRFVLEGTGTCGSVNVDWGDGITQSGVQPVAGQRIEFGGSNVESRTLTHTFTGWGGGKTVMVAAASGCEGTARLRFNTPPPERQIGFAQPGTAVCQTVTGNSLPSMIPRMLVHIQTVPLSPPNDRGISFGCAGCVYDADGIPGSSAPTVFPFPGLRGYSLVLRIGTQVVQGGTDVRFTTTASGPLEFCLNDADNDVTNNRGGYTIRISVDQLGS